MEVSFGGWAFRGHVTCTDRAWNSLSPGSKCLIMNRFARIWNERSVGGMGGMGGSSSWEFRRCWYRERALRFETPSVARIYGLTGVHLFFGANDLINLTFEEHGLVGARWVSPPGCHRSSPSTSSQRTFGANHVPILGILELNGRLRDMPRIGEKNLIRFMYGRSCLGIIGISWNFRV